MKILVSSMVFHPDHSGIALYSTDFAFYAAKKKHEVKVVTGFPFYPGWKKNKEDEGAFFRTEICEGVKIYRGYLYVPKNPTAIKRIAQEISFLVFAFVNILRAKKNDVIVIFTTPVTLGLLGWVSKIFSSSSLVINVQDFQVEAADYLGMLGNRLIVPLMAALEKLSYKQADLVTSISESMVDLLRTKGVEESKTRLWPNWIDVKHASALEARGAFRKKFNISDEKLIIGYAGNVGVKQGLETLIDLAYEMGGREDLLFLIIGEGGDLLNLKTYHARKNANNLRFLPFLDPRGYREFLADSDVIFISQKKIPADIYFPSKLLGIMATSKLILLSADRDSELYRVLDKYELGLVSEFGNIEEMKTCLRKVTEGDECVARFRRNARDFVGQFDRQVVLDGMLEKMETLVKK